MTWAVANSAGWPDRFIGSCLAGITDVAGHEDGFTALFLDQ
jgi:hypothetical protein